MRERGDHDLCNAGHSFVSARVLIAHWTWRQRPGLRSAIRTALGSAAPLPAYYPGTDERHRSYLDADLGTERDGHPSGGVLLYLFVGDNPAEPALSTDPFYNVLADVTLDAHALARFVDQAAELCNERVWGSLGVGLLVHPHPS